MHPLLESMVQRYRVTRVFPGDYTLIDYRGKLAADGPRYRALGNSMAVQVMCWIGKRIAAVDAILRDSSGAGRRS